MKRLLVVVFFAFLITALFVLPASADTNITNVSIQVVAPEIGAEPDYSPWLDDVTYYLDDYNNDTFLNDVYWYDVTAQRALNVDPMETFQANHQYQVNIYLTPADGYAFTESSKGTINGNTATASKHTNQLKLSYTFPKLPKGISAVSVTITEPAIGASPDYSPVLGNNIYYSADFNNNNFQNDVRWTDVTGSTTMNTSTSKFQAGHVYRVEIYLTPKDGYVFLENTTAKLNGVTASADRRPSSGQLRITYDFPEVKAPIPITSVSVYLGGDPYVGDKPDYDPSVCGPDDASGGAHCYSADFSNEVYKNDMAWFDVTDDEYLPVATGKFKAGHQYRVYVFLTAENGYYFADNFSGNIDSKAAEITTHSSTYIGLSYTFPTLPTTIDSVSISITSPVAGASPSYSAAVPSGAHYRVGYWTGEYYKDGVCWEDASECCELSVSSARFYSGCKYRVYVCVMSNDGYVISEDTTATVNGKTADIFLADGEYVVSYTFPKLPPAIATQPESQAAELGELVWFHVEVDNGLESVSYQWQYKEKSATTWNNADADYDTWYLTVTEEHYGLDFRCIATDEEGTTITTNTVHIYKPGTITKQPSSVTVAAGKTATFKVTAAGSELTYQWYYKKPGDSSWSQVKVNGTSATYSLATEARHSGNKYRCKVTCNGKSVYSSSATLTVVEKPAVTTQPAKKTVVEGKTATFTVAASGGGLSYQWYYRKPGETTWNKVTTNGTGATYSLKTEARHNGYTYHCVVKNAAGSVTSSNAKLTVTPGITTQPGNQTVAAGKTATFKVVATGTGLTYQWYYQKSGESTWNKVSVNGTSATYSLTTEARHSGNKYRCLVTNSGGGSVYSSTATLTVAEKPAITTQPGAKTVVEGKTATFKVAASGGGLSYQWYYRKPGETTWNKVTTNGTGATYSLKTEARHNGYTYHCVVKNAAGSVTSSNAKLTVTPGITTQPGNQTVAEGKTATFKVVATGTGLSYQWYYQKSGESTWNKVSTNGTSATYSLATEARHSGNKYRCLVTNSGGGSVYSNTVTLTVTAKPAITTQPSNKTVTAGAKATFKVVASGTGLSYQWYYQKPGESTWNKVSTNGTSATYSLTTEARHNGYQYKCTVSNTAGSVTSKVVKLTVK